MDTRFCAMSPPIQRTLSFAVSSGTTRTSNGRWDVWYELANHHLDGFSDNRDDLLQHQLRASHDTQIGDGWDLSLTADATAWDEEGALAIGIYLQRRF